MMPSRFPPLRAATLLALLLGASRAAPRVAPCDAAADASQQWAFADGGLLQSALPGGSCLATLDCAPATTGAVGLVACGSTACGAAPAPNLRWALDAQGRLAAGNGSLCLTLANGDGPGVNLWPCAGAEANGQWDRAALPAPPGFFSLATRDAGAGRGCLAAAGGTPGGVAVLNASALGRRVYGIGGLAAIGGARLIYEYAEPARSQILDLLFNSTGGTAFQVLKTEIEGDMDSSYGSGPSFQHSRGEATSFRRGIYLPWLLGEAKRRNPAIGTYSLSWGRPGWVGNGSGFLTQEGLDYHMRYLEGVRDTYGYSFDLTGIHNERPFSRSYTIALRAALDAAGFNSTLISVNDDGNSGCTDCQGFKDDAITTALANDPAFARALGYIGLHSAGPLPRGGYDWEAAGKSYIQSEANDVDGPLIETADGSFPQWAGNAGSPDGPGIEWPLHFISNYLNSRITGMIICPLSHAWTWGYGRHNHGTALFIRPWDGHFVLGAAFWSQAHITQATRPGWHFLDGSASGTNGDTASYASFVSPALDALTVVAVNEDPAAPATLRFQLAGALNASFGGAALATWLSNATQLFRPAPDTPIGADGTFSFTLGPRSVLTLTTLRSLSHAEVPVPPRRPFPLPYVSNFAAQRLEEPGRLLSDLFGAFYVARDPLGSARGQVLRQAVPASPGANAWLGRDGLPFTSLPAPGVAIANGNISADVLITRADLPDGGEAAAAVSVCGRVPVWQPANYASQSAHLGVCLWLWANGTWAVVDAALEGADRTLAAGALAGGGGGVVGAWHSLALAFADDSLGASIDGTVVAAVPAGLRVAAGTYGLGTLWHTASFDAVRLDATAGHAAQAASWLLDVLPGEQLRSNVSAWAGFALDLRAPGSADLAVSGVGRFRARGNTGAHALDIVDAATNASVLAGGAVTVDFATCTTDALGFCYAAGAATLAAGRVYYVLSREAAGGDAFVAMYDAAAQTTHVHRDGTTLMSYVGPGKGAVTGRVLGADFSSLVVDGGIELMHGPLNLLLE
jgi:hypothetical protein